MCYRHPQNKPFTKIRIRSTLASVAGSRRARCAVAGDEEKGRRFLVRSRRKLLESLDSRKGKAWIFLPLAWISLPSAWIFLPYGLDFPSLFRGGSFPMRRPGSLNNRKRLHSIGPSGKARPDEIRLDEIRKTFERSSPYGRAARPATISPGNSRRSI